MSANSTKNLIGLITGVVSLMSGLVAISLIATNPHESASPVAAVARAPSSLVNLAFSPSKISPLVERTLVVNVDCIENLQPTAVDKEIKQVRLRGHVCQPSEESKTTEIFNMTNGFYATVFSLERNLVTSDYIHLSDGENHLVVTRTFAGGEKKTTEMVITRR